MEKKPAKSKIKNIENLYNQDGTRKTVTYKDGGINYVFMVEMEDGYKGTAYAKTENYPHDKGKEVSYDRSEFKDKYGNVTPKITGVKGSEYKKFGSSFNDPTANKENAYNMARDFVIDSFEKHDNPFDDLDTFNAGANYFYEWLMAKGNDKNIILTRYRNMVTAIRLSKNEAILEQMGVSLSGSIGKRIVDIADKLYDDVKSVGESD